MADKARQDDKENKNKKKILKKVSSALDGGAGSTHTIGVHDRTTREELDIHIMTKKEQ